MNLLLNNIFKGISGHFYDEVVETIQKQNNLKIERIVSKGHMTPEGEWYDQKWHEWVLLLSGGAILKIEGKVEAIDMKPGDHIMLPAHTRHRVEWTDPEVESVWLAVHFADQDKASE